MIVYAVIKEWGYDGGAALQGIFSDKASAEKFTSSLETSEYHWYKIEEHTLDQPEQEPA